MAIEERHPEDAEALLHRALADLEPLKAIDDEAQAYVVLARALFSAGKIAEAAKATASAAPIVAQSHDRGVHIAFAVIEARVGGATGDPAKAMESLTKTLSEATRLGYIVYAFEARLALGEIEIKTGRANAGRQRLTTLEKDATAAGFVLIAHKAVLARG